jgi:hypothetical protein
MIKSSINIVSSREKCIKHALVSIWEGYNSRNNFPVNIYYFDDIYDDPSVRTHLTTGVPQDVRFIRINYQTPSHISEKDLFYNRTNNEYARNFGIHRKGYLHMCHLVSNMHDHPQCRANEHQWMIVHDDEGGYTRNVENDPIEAVERSGYDIGAYFVGQRLKNGAPHQGHLDTRVGLWDLTRSFINSNCIDPKNDRLRALMDDPNAGWNFHFLDWCDTYVINTDTFKTTLWREWIGAVNSHGGIYKHRWGDNEIVSLYAHMIQPEIVNVGLVGNGTYNQGLFRGLQDIAPSVKDINK